MIKKIAQFTPTKQQRQWVDDECERTNESQATVMRKLIQTGIDGLPRMGLGEAIVRAVHNKE